MTLESRLFYPKPLSQLTASKMSSAVSYIKKLDFEAFESNGLDQISEHVYSKYYLAPLELLEDDKKVDLMEIEMRAPENGGYPHPKHPALARPTHFPGYKLAWTIPFRGNADLFQCQPKTFYLVNMQAVMRRDSIEIAVEIFKNNQKTVEEETQELESKINEKLKFIKKTINNINEDVQCYNQSLNESIESNMEERRVELEKLHELKLALRVDVQPQKGASPLNEIEVCTIPLSDKKTESGAYIDEKAYADILQLIRKVGASMETTSAAKLKDEEGLRDILLVALNASMRSGFATGELFRNSGKTDIAILFENNAAFVAECKLWRGKSYLIKGLEQLLGYLTWRDAKAALIVFNRENKDFSLIQKQMKQILTDCKAYVRSNITPEGEWQILCRKPDDENRMIKVHIFLIDIYTK